MKRYAFGILCLIMITGLTLGTAASEWPRRPDRVVRQCDTVVYREALHFLSCAELEYRLDIPVGALGGLTLTALPDASTGQLTLDGVEAPLYTRLSREEVDRLVYEPADAHVTGHIGFIPEYGGYEAAVLRITGTADPVAPPSLWGEAVFTLSGMPRAGSIAAADQQGNYPKIQLIAPPQKGSVVIEGDRYVYTPASKAEGRDSFTIVAVDSRGVYSAPCTIAVEVGDTPQSQPTDRWFSWLRFKKNP